MTKVFFDYKVFFEQPLGGASKYIFELTNLLNDLSCDAKIISAFHINDYLHNNKYVETIYKFNLHYPKFTRRAAEEFNRFYFNWHTRKEKPNIVHFTDFNNYYINAFDGKKIITVYDLIHEKFENLYSLPDDYKKKKFYFFERMDHIISISESTKKDLMKFYNINEDKISVIHLGVSNKNDQNNFEKISNTIKKPFILFVGHRKRYKNFLRFIKAFSLSKNLVNDFDIVCFGKQSFDNNELSVIDKLRLKKNIHLVSGDDITLNYYYKNAELLVYPSLYEGFGLPLLEAMKNGCAVACSETSSLIEIGNDAVDFFIPDQEDSILSSLKRVLYSHDYKSKLIKNGYKNISNFTWEICAKKTLQIYEKLIL